MCLKYLITDDSVNSFGFKNRENLMFIEIEFFYSVIDLFRR